MQIDRPDANESADIVDDEIFVEPAAPLPPEPPPTALEADRVLSHDEHDDREPRTRRPLRIHPRSLLGLALISGGALAAALLAVVVMKRGARA
ncbi:MAG TPA: hypothetical protein VM925_37895 [Labilithrix sp.]|jgi:hypothetical protein|nr:hypothetical protein [Labilithrix sp.]